MTPLLRELGWLRVEDIICERYVLLMPDLLKVACTPEVIHDRVTPVPKCQTVLLEPASIGYYSYCLTMHSLAVARSYAVDLSSSWNSLPVNACIGRREPNTFKHTPTYSPLHIDHTYITNYT